MDTKENLDRIAREGLGSPEPKFKDIPVGSKFRFKGSRNIYIRVNESGTIQNLSKIVRGKAEVKKYKKERRNERKRTQGRTG